MSIPKDGGRATVIARVPDAFFYVPCWRADGALSAFVEHPRRGKVYGVFRAGAQPRWRALEGEIISADFAPGCDLVAEIHYAFEDDEPDFDGGVLIRDAAGKELTRVTGVERGEPETVVWSRDGSRFAVAMWETSRARTLRVIDARSGRVLARRRSFDAEIWGQAFSPDGSALVYIDGERLMILDVATGSVRRLAGGGDGRSYQTPAWSPRGDRIAAANFGGAIELLDVTSGHGPALRSTNFRPREIAWSPDGTTLAWTYERGGALRAGLAMAAAEPGARPRRVVAPRSWLASPVWSPDGSAVAVSWRG